MLSRRDFLKLALLSLGSVAWRPLRRLTRGEGTLWGQGLRWARVTISRVPIFTEPDYHAPKVGLFTRDTLFPILEEIVSPNGPPYNPRWYRTWRGFVHTAYTQRVGFFPQWNGAAHIPPSGRPAEVTVPYTQAYRLVQSTPWPPLYRLYYGSMHWVVDSVRGPSGRQWFIVEDDLLKVHYAVAAEHLRLLEPEEAAPLSPEVPPSEKHILISLSEQRLYAFEGETQVYEAPISSGVPSRAPTDNGIPTKTPSGRFFITSKAFNRHMGNGDLTTALEAYELPGVPWVSFFVETGVAIHGTYWHDNFGTPMSHGCINMRNEDARWVFRWSTPTLEATPDYWQAFRTGRGTTVKVVD